MKASYQGGSGTGGKSSSTNKTHGVFIGKIKSNIDPEGLGRLQVWIAQLSAGDETNPASWFTVRYCPPFAGASDTTVESQATDATKFKQTNQSYGMWMVPPDLNVNVVCSFLNGELQQGIWWACLPHDGHTHAIPAVASGATHDGTPAPVAERNRFNTSDPQQQRRPEHPQSDIIKAQGLSNDLRRGHINAGPFRNVGKHPGKGYGILTPGQHQFVMDDGEKGHSGKIRLRTNSGNTFIMDNDAGFIYMINATGNAWFQLDAEGNVDLFAAGDFSVNAEGSINLRAGNNINMEAVNNINARAGASLVAEACEVVNITGTTGMKLSTNQNMNILADSQFKITGQRVDINGPAADRAALPAENSLVTNSTVGKSIAGRVPEAEPYGGHTTRIGGEQPTMPSGTPDVSDPVITPTPESYADSPPPEKTDAIMCVPDVTQNRLSDEAFSMMKSREAYRGMMYSDFQGYSIGYGTRVDIWGPSNPASKIDDNLKQALLAGPSEAEARLASRQIVDRHIAPGVLKTLTGAMAGKNVCITQSQIDALIMAAYGNPAQANNMAKQLVASGLSAPDGKPTNADIASIWANSSYSNSANQRSSEAKYAMTGSANADTKSSSAAQLMASGVKSDEVAIKNSKARNPRDQWVTALGNGPKTGNKSDAMYGKPTAQQFGQWERSCYLNTGNVPYGANLTAAQLRDKYGAPHTSGNVPPSTPTAPA